MQLSLVAVIGIFDFLIAGVHRAKKRGQNALHNFSQLSGP